MLLGTLLTDKISNLLNTQKIKAAAKEQNDYLQAIFDAYNSGGSSQGIKENLGKSSRFTPEIENYLNSLDEAKKKGQEVKASLEDFGDSSQFKRIAEGANETSEAMKKVGDAGKQSSESIDKIGEAASSAADGMENISKSSASAGTSMSKLASVGKAILGTLANIAIYYAISEAITLAAEAWDNYANAQENAIERGNTALANMDENNSKVDAMKSALDAVNENTVEVDGQTITRFQQLSEGVNSLGENVSLSSSEFEEYTTILNSLTDAGFTATGSMSALKREMQEMQDSVNYANLEGLNDWVDSFNAQNNQIVSDFTKEVGYQQRIEALEKLQSAADSGKMDAVQEQSWWERILGNLSMSQDMAAAQNAMTPWNVDEAEALMDAAQENYEQLIQDATDTAAYKELAEKYAIDIFNDSGEIDEEKFLESGNLQRMQDAMKQEMSAREAMVKESAGFLESMFELTPQYKNMSEQVQSTISSLFNNIDYATIEKYMTDSNGQLSSDLMRDWVESLSKNISADEIQSNLDQLFEVDANKAEMGLTEYKDTVQSLIDNIVKEVPELSDEMLKSVTGFNETVEALEPAYNKLKSIFGEDVEKIATEDLEIAANLVAEDNFSDNFDLFLQQIEKAKIISGGAEVAFESASTAANELLSSITSAFSVLSSQSTGSSISFEDFTSDELEAYTSALEYNNGTLQLNEERVRELAKAQAEEKIAANEAAKAQLQEAYHDNAVQINELRKKIQEKNFAEEESAESIQATINSLYDSNNAIANQCDQLDVLSMNLREATGEYQNWLNAQNAVETGDMFSDAVNATQAIRDTANTESEDYGRIGTKKYMAAVDFVVPDNIDSEDADAVQSYLDSISYAFIQGEDGVIEGLNLQGFLDTAVSQGLMEIKDDEYVLKGQQTMESFAQGMNMSLPLVQAIFGELQEFTPGGEGFSWADEAYDNLGDAYLAVERDITTLQESLDSLNPNVDTAQIDQLNQKLQEANATKDELAGEVEVKVESYFSLDEEISDYENKLNALNQKLESDPTNIQIQADISDTESKLDELNQKKNQLEAPTTAEINIYTQNAQAELESIETQLSNYSNSEWIAQAGISAEDAQAQISALTSRKDEINDWLLKVNGDTSDADSKLNAVENTQLTDKNISVTANVAGALSNLQSVKDSLSTIKSKTVTVTTNYVTTHSIAGGSPSARSGSGNVSGTAHVSGTAKVSGDWGTKVGQRVLIGELGPEIVVDPASGKWRTYGDNGAEFAYIPSNAIIFNHLQSRSLLEQGFVNSRGTARASGTAFVSGGISVSTAHKVSQATKDRVDEETKKTAKATQQAAQSVQKAASDTTSTVSDEADKFEETLDWIQNYLDRAARNLDVLTDAADKLDGYISQNRYLNEAQGKVKESIAANTNAYNKYMQEAYAVGLSPVYQQKIMSGTLDIETITDENLSNQIKEFQDLYDKALDCADAISDLNAQYVELANQRLSNIQQDFEGLVDVTDAIYDNFSAGNDIREAMGQTADISNLERMIYERNNGAKWLRGEFEKMNQELTYMMNQGSIKKYSEDWYAWQAELHNISAALKENQADVIELRQQIREVRWQTFEDAVGKIDAANDELDHTLSLIDDLNSFVSDSGVLNATGITKIGLLGKQLGNARQLVAEYSNAISLLNTELYNGNISQEQYNEEMQEYKSAQQDAISSVKEYRDAIVDLIKDGINAETDAMQKLVDKRKEDLQAQKDAADYAKSLRDQTSTINKIQAQITALEGDDSASAQAQLRNLKNQLREEQMNLQDMQDDHRYEELINGYDAAMEQFEAIQNAEIENLETSLDAQNQAIQTMLGVAKEQYQTVYNELNHIAEVYGFKLSSDLSDPWKNAQNAAQAYKEAVDKVIAEISVNVSKLPSLSTGTADVTYAENVDPSRPTPEPQAPATQTPAASSTAGMVSGIGPMLRVGSRGDSVKALQSALNQMGYNAGNVDGIFGNNTKNAVVRFQRDNGISADGIVGPNTKQKFAIHGYAHGTKKANTGLAYTDENGSELIATKYGVIRQLDYGDMVFSNEQLQMLWDFSKSRIANTLPKVNANTPTVNLDAVGMQVDTFLRIENVEGNVDQSILPTINNMIRDSIAENNKNIRKQIKKDARKTGLI